jgi:hypothetical protein
MACGFSSHYQKGKEKFWFQWHTYRVKCRVVRFLDDVQKSEHTLSREEADQKAKELKLAGYEYFLP